MISIPFFAILIGFSVTNAKQEAKNEDIHEFLVPLDSLTPLMCEPVFFNKDDMVSATWYKNGVPLGRISSQKNLIYENRLVDLKEIPEVGFLIIPNTKLEDEGDYWCEQDGVIEKPIKVYRLQVAFIDKFEENQRLTAYPPLPEYGHTLTINCPTVKSHPKAVISWKVNDEPVDFASGRIEVTKNGSLLIRRFSNSDGGVYSCTWHNFAGHSSAQIQLFAPVLYSLQNDIFDYAQVQTGCAPYFRNGLLWFLIGCLSTSCVVLIYLMAGLFCYKYSRRAAQFTPLHSVFRADPSLAPGFRKAIVPAYNYINPNVSNAEAV
ncbi:hypothetical protein M3Y97_00594800 [Aphelenchoides bicaudatus]|nr:hypothetical protein M3Y97_00594800 [Aphelenchoides bicaudatus]